MNKVRRFFFNLVQSASTTTGVGITLTPFTHEIGAAEAL